MRAGARDQRIQLQEKDVSRDAGIGEEVVTWTTLATLWADVQPLRGRELFAAAQLQESAEIRVSINYRAGVTADMRIVWQGVPYDITSPPIQIDGKKRTLELMCASGIHDAR